MQEEQTVNEKEYVFEHINSDFRILILHFAPLIAATRVLQCKVTPAVSASARFSGSGEQKCRQIKIRPVGSTISFHVRKGAVRLLAMFSFRRSTSAGGICPVEPCDSTTPAAKGAAGRQSGEWSGLKRVHIR